MKNTCMVPLVFIATSICLAVPITFFVALANPSSFSLLLNGEVGYYMTFWLYTFFSYLPLCLILGFLGVYFYLMRHKSVMPISILIVITLMCVSLLVLIPVFYKTMHSFENSLTDSLVVQKKYTEQIFSNSRIRAFSPTKRYVWFLSDAENSSVQPLIIADDLASATNSLTVFDQAFIDTTETSVVASGKIIASGIPTYDPVIFDSHQVPLLLRVLSGLVTTTLLSFYKAAQQGFAAYLWVVIPFFIALLSLWPWCNWTQWRLLNILLCAGGLIILFVLFPISISPEYLDILPMMPFYSLVARFSHVFPHLLFVSINVIVIFLVSISRNIRSSSKGRV